MRRFLATVLAIGPDAAFVGIPGEYFAESALRIRMQSRVAHTFAVGQANGKLGQPGYFISVFGGSMERWPCCRVYKEL